MSKDHVAGRAKLIVNPGAGKMLASSKILEQVTQALLGYGVPVDVALAHPTKEAVPIVKKAVKHGYSTVIAMGGDGTISAVIRGLAGKHERRSAQGVCDHPRPQQDGRRGRLAASGGSLRTSPQRSTEY